MGELPRLRTDQMSRSWRIARSKTSTKRDAAMRPVAMALLFRPIETLAELVWAHAGRGCRGETPPFPCFEDPELAEIWQMARARTVARREAAFSRVAEIFKDHPIETLADLVRKAVEIVNEIESERAERAVGRPER
jgi:hypothetical protein